MPNLNITSCSLRCPPQIGRSTESPIDFVVTDTSGGGKEGEDPSIAPSTISRFACRVVCERNPPYTARIYAAGFDSSKNIFLGVSGLKISPTKVYFWNLCGKYLLIP